MAPAINLIDPEYFAQHGHPWEQYEWLRANAPVFWHDEPDGPGFWAITKYDDIVLKRGLSADSAIIDWHTKVLEGAVERTNGSIVIYDNAGTEVGRWNFEAGWPSKWSASDLDAGTDDVMIEELTISHEGLFKA